MARAAPLEAKRIGVLTLACPYYALVCSSSNWRHNQRTRPSPHSLCSWLRGTDAAGLELCETIYEASNLVVFDGIKKAEYSRLLSSLPITSHVVVIVIYTV